MTKSVLVPIANGTEEIEAVSIIDTLRRAGAEVTVASVETQNSAPLQVIASRGVKLVADARIADCAGETYDCIALPGGMPGAEHLRDCAPLIGMLKQQKESGRLIAAICAAPAVVLKHHDLLENVKATCHPSFHNRLDPNQLSHNRVVADANIITSQGAGTAIEFALTIVEHLFGPAKKKEAGTAMVVQGV
jgi:4-methyl-5(b-hydroxyethyl)-thiazole monophosphate biosynthesis